MSLDTLALVIFVGTVLLSTVLFLGARALHRKEQRIRRVQAPARLLSHGGVSPDLQPGVRLATPLSMLTVEFLMPDGSARTAVVPAAYKRGVPAVAPQFSGYVYVNPEDPSDVVTRPRARMLPVLLLGGFGAFVLVAGCVGALVLWGVSLMDLPG